MKESLPHDAFAPFIHEIKKREKQRKERAWKVFLVLTMKHNPRSTSSNIFRIPTSYCLCLPCVLFSYVFHCLRKIQDLRSYDVHISGSKK